MSLFKNTLFWHFILLSIYQVHFISEVYSDSQITISAISPINGSVTPDTRSATDPFSSHNGDNSLPSPTKFCWSTSPKALPITYSIYISEDSIVSDTDIAFLNISDTQYNVWNLKINTRYFWIVSVHGLDTTGEVFRSPVFTFNNPDLWPRMIFIEGTNNMRDIGGITNIDGKKVAQGLFYRSASFDTAANLTANRLDQFKQLDIVCEIDLRGNYDDVQIGPWLKKYVHPLTDSSGGMYSYYYGLLNTSSAYRAVFKEMTLKQNYPIILHCTMGADRTGTVVALL